MACKPIDLLTFVVKPIIMNLTKKPSLIICALTFLTFHASAVEYVTMRDSTQVVNLNPTDVVEIVSVGVHIRFDDQVESSSIGVQFEGGQNQILQTSRGHILTSLVGISTRGDVVTIKITRANEINAVQPTSMLVIPENATGNYDIIVETSDDTATWTPFHSQTVSAADAKRFFRTRIVKKN